MSPSKTEKLWHAGLHHVSVQGTRLALQSQGVTTDDSGRLKTSSSRSPEQRSRASDNRWCADEAKALFGVRRRRGSTAVCIRLGRAEGHRHSVSPYGETEPRGGILKETTNRVRYILDTLQGAAAGGADTTLRTPKCQRKPDGEL